MLAAIQRLLLISLGTIFLTILAVVFVRWTGEKQVFAEPPHAWFSINPWTVVNPDLCNEETIKGASTELIWVPVHFKHGGWNVKCEKEKLLKDVIPAFTHKNWLIYVDSHEAVNLDSLIQILEPFDKNKFFGIFAPSQTVARYLRKKAPQWVYGADAATLLRLHMFASFWIETAFDFWPDFVVQTPGDKNSQLSERERRELERRKKRVIQVEFTP